LGDRHLCVNPLVATIRSRIVAIALDR